MRLNYLNKEINNVKKKNFAKANLIELFNILKICYKI